MTPLMLAAGLGRLDALRLLIEKGARRGTTTQSRYRLVALRFAAWAQSPECIQALLEGAPTPEQLRVEISLGAQRAALIKNGVEVCSTGISTGRPGYPTAQGRFVVTDKDPSHVSTIYKVPMPFFMRLSCQEFGMHEGDAALPFASHGCIRLPRETARRFYREVPVGTLVTIGP
jgi:lipoprotein-anchoring transpeptidase ErfK/SrfK